MISCDNKHVFLTFGKGTLTITRGKSTNKITRKEIKLLTIKDSYDNPRLLGEYTCTNKKWDVEGPEIICAFYSDEIKLRDNTK